MNIDFDAVAEAISPHQLAEAVGAEKTDAGWRCPLGETHHRNGDKDPSFSVFRDGERTAARCHGCGLRGSPVTVASQVWGVEPPEAARKLARAIGLRPATNGGRPGRSREPEAVYTYRDLGGEVAFQVVRFPGKQFRQRSPDPLGDGWEWTTKGVEKPLYRITDVVERAAMGGTIYVVEGEKDANRLREEGVTATTCAGGAGSWRDRYAEALEGAHVKIVADRDDAGREHAREVAASLDGVAASVDLLLPAVAEEGADVSDHLDAGHDLDDLVALGEADVPAAGRPERDDGHDDEELTFTDTGNSERLAHLHGDRLHYLPPWDKWIVEGVDGPGFWTLDHGDVHVRELAKDVGRDLKHRAAEVEDTDRSKRLFKWGIRSLSSGRITAMVNLSRGIGEIPLDYQELDADGWVLGTENGVVELETGTLRDARPDDLITRRCSVPYDPAADAPRWERALEEWFPDPDLRAYVKRVAGAALVGAQKDHILVIHYGTGRNGKGTFVRALLNVLGDYAGVAHLSLLVQQKHSEHDTVKADLFRKRLAVASETERRVQLREASVKNLTGGDRITARRMREDPWEFDPTHSIWLQTNHLPEIAGRDRGIWSRLRVVKWESVFKGEDADPRLDEKLAEEAGGILRWLVEGCLDWQDEGLDEPEAVVRETLDYRQSEDTLARFKSDVGLAFSPELEIQAGELQDVLTGWANEEGVSPPRQEIGDWLREHGCEKKQRRVTVDGKTKRPRFWIGVGIDGEGHETEQTDALA